MTELKLGSQGPEVGRFYDYMHRYAPAYASLLGRRDLYYGGDEDRFTRELQRRLNASGVSGIVIDGKFGDRTAAAVGYRWTGTTTPPVVEQRRPIWYYSAPGSGAPWNIGPGFDLGQMVSGNGLNEPGRQSLRINHQPVGYPIGGYLGLMGGDPALSYIDVINAQAAELERLLWANADVIRAMDARRRDASVRVDVELWIDGYSQSADGAREAVLKLFDDDGPFALIRDRINGLVLYGDPATPVTGIARKTFPGWLEKLVHDINVSNDFYAVARDKLRPLFYEWFIRAETELPFVVYSAQIVIPALMNFVPIIGGLAGPLAPLILAGAAGAQSLTPLLTSVIGGVNGAANAPNPELVKTLTLQGFLSSVPDLMGLITALPGLQAHGGYQLPLADFGGRTGPQVGYDIIADYRR